MAPLEVVAAAHEATNYSGERHQTVADSFKVETGQEHPSSEVNPNDSATKKRLDGATNASVISTYGTSNGLCRGSGYHSEGDNTNPQTKRPDGVANAIVGSYNTSNGHCRGSGYYNEAYNGDFIGYNSSTGGWEDSIGYDARHMYPGVHVDNGQHVYYASGYGYPHQPAYCSQPSGPYVSNMGAGPPSFAPQSYGHFYQQVPPSSGMHYYPSPPVPPGQEGCMFGPGKLNLTSAGQPNKVKPGVGGRPGHQRSYRAPPPSNGSNRWGVLPSAPNAGYRDSPSGCEFFSQQWHSSARCLQPITSPQNVPISGKSTPPIPSGCTRQQCFPRVHSAPNMIGRGAQGNLKTRPVKAGSVGSNWRAKEVSKHQGKSEGHANDPNGFADNCTEQTLKSLTVKSKGQPTAFQVPADVPCHLSTTDEPQSDPVNRSDYNKEDFEIIYEAAKFFIIKSYSEDDIHKSIKYRVWSSTPNGNKRLDEAYREAQEKSGKLSSPCPVYFFFSVNSSGQFCGVAEMVGSVDFSKNMDFWLQGKWNGCLPVKWHVIKDVPNSHFRHIILLNNDNKPVTHSRDTQEVYLDQGMEMLKIFKFFPTRTSLLDDFAFYDGRQRVLQERKSRQLVHRQAVKQVEERLFETKIIASDASTDEDKENGRPVEPPDADLKVTRAMRVIPATELKVDTMTNADAPVECPVTELKVDAVTNADAPVESNGDILVEPKPEISLETAENMSKSSSDSCYLPEGKGDLATTVINYKKALLEGVQGKVILLDKGLGV